MITLKHDKINILSATIVACALPKAKRRFCWNTARKYLQILLLAHFRLYYKEKYLFCQYPLQNMTQKNKTRRFGFFATARFK